jgi:hypothetical protein
MDDNVIAFPKSRRHETGKKMLKMYEAAMRSRLWVHVHAVTAECRGLSDETAAKVGDRCGFLIHGKTHHDGMGIYWPSKAGEVFIPWPAVCKITMFDNVDDVRGSASPQAGEGRPYNVE